MNMIHHSVLLAMIGLASCTSTQQDKPQLKRIRGATFDAVYPANCREDARKLIPRIEAALPFFVNSQMSGKSAGWGLSPRKVLNMREYKRQYLFTGETDQTNVLILCFHESTEEVQTGEWLTMYQDLGLGGGDSRILLIYDLRKDQFTKMRINEPL